MFKPCRKPILTIANGIFKDMLKSRVCSKFKIMLYLGHVSRSMVYAVAPFENERRSADWAAQTVPLSQFVRSYLN